jgi:hypothetical protein
MNKLILLLFLLLHIGYAGADTYTHSKKITGLQPGTTYNLRIRTTNPDGSVTVSPNKTFTTNSSPISGVSVPALVNPVNPMNYGALCNGVTNDIVAFQAAVNASDVLVPANKTCVINGAVNITQNNRHIQCGANTILKQTVTGGNVFLLHEAVSGQRLTGASIANCTFIGTNTIPPANTDWNNPSQHWNIPVLAQDRVDNFILVGNTFDRFYGQAMFQTAGFPDGGHGDKISYNTFKNCGYYGPVFAAHQNGYIGHNTAIDCAVGVENDNDTQLSGGIVIEYNTLSVVYGYGGLSMDSATILTGGCAGNPIPDYHTNIVRNNSVSGIANSQGAHPGFPSRIYICAQWIGAKAAQYSNNSCTNGCQVIP